jgi:hypothetical protein
MFMKTPNIGRFLTAAAGRNAPDAWPSFFYITFPAAGQGETGVESTRFHPQRQN